MMLSAIHITDIREASHKPWLKILMYHHFVIIAPSDRTNRAYLRVKNLTIIAIEMRERNLINHYLNGTFGKYRFRKIARGDYIIKIKWNKIALSLTLR